MKKGDIIRFGNYPQDSDGTIAYSIEWLVLDIKKPSIINRLFKKDKKIEVLLISRYGLDSIPYNPNCTDITWENCLLRKWLNNDFIKSAFSEEEAKRIKVSELKNEDNLECDTKGGNDTQDRVFCLSIDEFMQYLTSYKDQQCQLTPYAEKHGAFKDSQNYCYWWLRSPGGKQSYASFVNTHGGLSHGCFHIRDYGYGGTVRPALRIICNL